MLINTANLAAMFTAYSLLYQEGYGNAEIFYRDIATIVPSSTETNTYAWMEKIPKMRRWIGPRAVQNLVARGPRVVVNDPFELTLEIPKHKIQDDTYGIYRPYAQMMGEQAAKWPDDVVAEKLLENPAAFDGQAFFSKNHPVNIEKPSMGTYSNLETSFPLTLANYGIAKTRFRKFKGADGRPIGARGSLLIVPPSLEETAKTILNSQFYPRMVDGGTLATSGAGVIENQWRGTADLLVIDELEDNPGNWYLFDARKAIKPLLFQLREAPVFTYLTNPNDPNVFYNKQFVMGVESRGAADVTLPFLAFQGQA